MKAHFPTQFLIASLSLIFAAECIAKAAPISPRLIEPLEFAHFTVTNIPSQQRARELMAEKIRVGSKDADAYDILSKAGVGPKKHVETVKQYRAAKNDGYSASTSFDLAMESFFTTTETTLNFMDQAKPSQLSLFSTKDLNRLPVSVLSWNEGSERDRLKKEAKKGMTLLDCTASSKHPIQKLKFKAHSITFSDDGCDYEVQELARGDYDHDGCEDALICVASYNRGGSGRGYESFIVTRTGAKQRQLKIIRLGEE